MQQVRRERVAVVVVLAVLAVVHAARMVMTDPLAPAVEMQLISRFVPGESRVADEP
jgi:hypothetical protein